MKHAYRCCPAASQGMTLIEVLIALCLVGSSGMLALAAAHSTLTFAHSARAEAAGLAAGQAKVEELLSLTHASRREGFDEVEFAGERIVRTWRVRSSEDMPGLERIEVTSRWDAPVLTLLVLVAVAP